MVSQALLTVVSTVLSTKRSASSRFSILKITGVPAAGDHTSTLMYLSEEKSIGSSRPIVVPAHMSEPAGLV